MNILQSRTLKKNKRLSESVARSDKLLQAAVASVNGTAEEGSWDLIDDDGSARLRLSLKDAFHGQAATEFGPEEIEHDDLLRGKFLKLGADLVWISRWRTELNKLYRNIRSWCRKLPGGASVLNEKGIVREVSGEYEVPQLVIQNRGQFMRVEPVAAWVVGADGRVDLSGVGGPLILLFSKKDSTWFFCEQFPFRTVPLTEDLFLRLAEECLHG